MKDLLHGWRRKVGLVTLMMACVIMTEWMRSRLHQGECLLEYEGSIRSHDEAIRLLYDSWSPKGLVHVEREVVIPYFVIVLPLTLLSAYLILWKPPKGLSHNSPVPLGSSTRTPDGPNS